MKIVEYGAKEKETILLLHGGGLSWWNYRASAELLQQEYHVLLPVLDGHAESGAPFVSIEETAERLLAYLDEHYSGRLLLLGGVSLGAQIALEMLAQRPDIARFALIESASVLPQNMTASLIAPMLKMSYPLIAKPWFARLQFASLRLPSALFSEYYRDSTAISRADMIAFLKASTRYTAPPALAETSAQVLLITGQKERALLHRSAKKLQQMLPRSRWEQKAGLFHGEFSLKHPADFAETLRTLVTE